MTNTANLPSNYTLTGTTGSYSLRLSGRYIGAYRSIRAAEQAAAAHANGSIKHTETARNVEARRRPVSR